MAVLSKTDRVVRKLLNDPPSRELNQEAVVELRRLQDALTRAHRRMNELEHAHG